MIVANFSQLDRNRAMAALPARAAANGETVEEYTMRGLKRALKRAEKARLRGVWAATKGTK